MTLDEIKSQVLREIGDLGEYELFVKETDIENWIYEAELRIARRADLLDKTDTTHTTTAGTSAYSSPADELALQKVEVDGYRVEQIDFLELGNVDERPSTASAAAVPYFWYYRTGNINFYPAPGNTGDQITIYYSYYPTKLTTGSSSPTVPVEFHPALVTYCLMRAKEMEEETQDALHFMERFERDLADIEFEEQHGHNPDYPSVRTLPGDDW